MRRFGWTEGGKERGREIEGEGTDETVSILRKHEGEQFCGKVSSRLVKGKVLTAIPPGAGHVSCMYLRKAGTQSVALCCLYCKYAILV
jgi:hypothetical protein